MAAAIATALISFFAGVVFASVLAVSSHDEAYWIGFEDGQKYACKLIKREDGLSERGFKSQ